MDKTLRFSVSLPENLLKELDKRTIHQGYSSRSELIRDMIREKMLEEKWEEEGQKVGVLCVVYDHHQRDLNQKLIDIQHKSPLKILCTTHIHIDHHNCLENIILEGEAKEIESFVLVVSGIKGVKFAKLTRTTSF